MPRLVSAVLLLACVPAAASELPAGLPEVALGMSQEALLAARPEIRRKNYSGVTVPATRPHNSWNEHLAAGAWPYRFARYDVKGGVLVGVRLTGDPTIEEQRAARLQAMAGARALWGPDYAAELEAHAVATTATAVWTKGDRVVRLALAPKPKKVYVGSAHISLDVRLASESVIPQTKVVLPAAERARLFEECGVEDRRASAEPGPSYDELLAAPQSVLIDGREVILTAYLRRDFAKHPAQDGEPMTANFTALARDGKPIPAGVRFDGAWIRNGRDLWHVPALTTERRGSTELRAAASGGPRWGGKAHCVVRLIGLDGRAVLLAAPARDIVYGNFR